jgi:uncharacterized GH25 family protein
MKKVIATGCLVLIGFVSSSHEFWLRPQKFRFAAGEDIKINFLVGENFTGEPWDITHHKIIKLEALSAYGRKDVATQVKPGAGPNLTLKAAGDGLHLIALESNAAFIELEADKFNAYLEEDGLEDIIRRRKENNEMNKPSRENYTRYAKLLVQSGTRKDEIYKRKVGFKLEIIPQQDPYQLKSGDYLDCLVLFDGKPAAHRMVKIWSQIGKSIFEQNAFTENDGTLRFPISNPGPWMVSTVYMEPSGKEGIDYESSWASLVFGID